MPEWAKTGESVPGLESQNQNMNQQPRFSEKGQQSLGSQGRVKLLVSRVFPTQLQ